MAKRIEGQDITRNWAGRRVEAARLCQRTHLKIHLVMILITLLEIYHLVVIFINDGEYTLPIHIHVDIEDDSSYHNDCHDNGDDDIS